MTRDNLCHAFMVIMGVGAIYLNCAEPIGRSRYAVGLSSYGSSQQVVSPVPASIPSAGERR